MALTQDGLQFVLFPSKQGNIIEGGVVLNTVCILIFFLSLRGPGFRLPMPKYQSSIPSTPTPAEQNNAHLLAPSPTQLLFKFRVFNLQMSDIQLANAIVVLNFTVSLYATFCRRHKVPTSFKSMLECYLHFAHMLYVT